MWVTVVYEDGKVSGSREGIEVGQSANRETEKEKSAEDRIPETRTEGLESLRGSREGLIYTAGDP